MFLYLQKATKKLILFDILFNLYMDLILIELIESLSHSIDNNEYTIGILVELSKTFDTVETKIVISKLNHYGIRGTPLMWYNDYLSDRKQTVRFSETRSPQKISL